MIMIIENFVFHKLSGSHCTTPIQQQTKQFSFLWLPQMKSRWQIAICTLGYRMQDFRLSFIINQLDLGHRQGCRVITYCPQIALLARWSSLRLRIWKCYEGVGSIPAAVKSHHCSDLPANWECIGAVLAASRFRDPSSIASSGEWPWAWEANDCNNFRNIELIR